jgi:hypothetical protein
MIVSCQVHGRVRVARGHRELVAVAPPDKAVFLSSSPCPSPCLSLYPLVRTPITLSLTRLLYHPTTTLSPALLTNPNDTSRSICIRICINIYLGFLPRQLKELFARTYLP